MPREEIKKETGHGIYEKEGKYHCEDCHAEVPEYKDCPTCHKAVDWDKAWIVLKRI